MQVTTSPESLSAAIDFLEEILNTKDGEALIESIKKYKKTKSFDEIELI